jgi:SAM-dependent methyltransferase
MAGEQSAMEEPPRPPGSPVSPWVARFAPLIRQGGPVLDLACGKGRHALYLRTRGHPVTALDRDVAALRAEPDQEGLEIIAADLEQGAPWPLGTRRFAAVLVTNYLYRPLFPDLLGAIEPGGLLIYETFALGNERFGRPRNPDHLLRPNELLRLIGDAPTVIAYEYLTIGEPYPAVMQRICARF